MNDMLEMQWMAMKFQFGLLLGLSAWALALNLSFGLINNVLKEMAEKVLPEESERIARVFNSKTYRVIAWLLDKLARIKVPTAARKASGNSDIMTKSIEPPKP